MQGTFLDAVNTGKNPTKAAKFLKETAILNENILK
jgi:hypothetical protein